MKTVTLTSAILASAMAVITGSAFAADWPSYGGDNGSRKYSELDQINASNVAELTTAWIWESPDNATVA